MLVNITECMKISGLSTTTGRRKCKHLDKGSFGGYICKRGNQIDPIPRIRKDSEICKDKEVSRSA